MKIFNRLIPFLVLGVMIVIFAVGLILLSYLLIFGAIIGMLLFVIAWTKEKFFPTKTVVLTKKNNEDGRTINHDDY